MLKTDLAQSIKRSVTAFAAAEKYGFQPNRAGFICCPFHSEKTPSCKVRNNERGFMCFGCKTGGSVIDFVERVFDLNFEEACRKINDDFCLCLPIDRPATAREKKAAFEAEKKRRREKEKKEELENQYFHKLGVFLLMQGFRFDHAPKKADDEWDDLFCAGLLGFTQAKFDLEEAEWAMLNQ